MSSHGNDLTTTGRLRIVEQGIQARIDVIFQTRKSLDLP